ncbi:Uncharacterised protein [Vibrio cholerae]|uniref:Uncharacterized protein n=1 Tax=Vibrio cholerae TaxID=666 RepID=A0A656AP52_VIBCL|nr:Uncharacterised protein [Vibrio cholerae]CSC84217.1 Uncharacterised protein [Vibrio cholerae]CSD24278.1 Uncharacterised protein [Vibrio cholerae]
MNVSWHDANLTLIRCNHTWAVRANHTNASLFQFHFDINHVSGRNAFSDGHNKLDASIDRFQNRIFTKWCWYVDNSCGCASHFNGFTNGIKYR